MPHSLSKLWNLISGAERRSRLRRSRAASCRVRFDEAAIEIEVRERPAWRDRVAWDQIRAVGIARKGVAGPGLYLFLHEQLGPVWASLEGSGGPELHQELKRRGVPFRRLVDLWRELDQRLKEQARGLVRTGFPQAEWPAVERALASYRGANTGRTHLAIVRLADGQLARLRELVAAARDDGSAAMIVRDHAEHVPDRVARDGGG